MGNPEKPFPSITFRPGNQGDTGAIFEIFYNSLSDFILRHGHSTEAEVQEPGRKERWRAEWQPILEHLSNTADLFWIAERDGQPFGYARSILRGDSRELTEFFVQPEAQSSGVGGELLRRAFSSEGAEHRSILATVDSRALALYLKQGVIPRSPIYTFYRAPQPRQATTDLIVWEMGDFQDCQDRIDELDDCIVGYRRAVDHAWLGAHRRGFFYLRGGRSVGYAYLGEWSGPVAVLEESDLPAVMAHLETEAHHQGMEEFGLDVALVNRTAVDSLLGRGFKMSSFQVLFMSEREVVNLANYLFSSPEFFV